MNELDSSLSTFSCFPRCCLKTHCHKSHVSPYFKRHDLKEKKTSAFHAQEISDILIFLAISMGLLEALSKILLVIVYTLSYPPRDGREEMTQMLIEKAHKDCLAVFLLSKTDRAKDG